MAVFAFTWANITIQCFLLSYLVTFLLELSRRLSQKHRSATRGAILVSAAAGFVAHTVYLFVRSQANDLPPLLRSMQDWMLVLAWLLVLFYWIATLRNKDLTLGIFVLPVVLLIVGATSFTAELPGSVLSTQRRWAMLHASLLVFGMGGVALGSVTGFMYLFQHRRLKRKHGGQSGLGIPSLAKLARYNRLAVLWSFPLLTLGMLTGVALGLFSSTPEGNLFSDPVIIAYCGMWSLMAVFFGWLWMTNRPAGKQVAWMTIWGFGFLLLTIVGLSTVSGGIH